MLCMQLSLSVIVHSPSNLNSSVHKALREGHVRNMYFEAKPFAVTAVLYQHHVLEHVKVPSFTTRCAISVGHFRNVLFRT